MLNQGFTKNIKINTNRVVLWVGLCLIFFIVAVRNILKIELPVILILMITVGIALFAGKSELIALFVSFIPLSGAFQYKYAILICLLIFLVKYKKDFKFSWFLVPLLLMIAWELLHSLGCEYSLVEFLREILLCTILIMSNIKDIDYKLVVRTLAICVLFVLGVMLIKLLMESNFDFMSIFNGTYRFGVSEKGAGGSYALNFNANQLGFICNLTIIGLLQLIHLKQNNKLDIVFIIALVAFGFMTMSRTFILCLSIIFVLFLFSGKETVLKKIKKAFGLILLIGALLILVYIIMPFVIDRLLERFQEDDVTGGRSKLFVLYLDLIFSDVKILTFGLGMQNLADKLTIIFGQPVDGAVLAVPHNGIEELIVVWGLPGLAIFSSFILALFVSAKKSNKITLLSCFPLILIFIATQAGQLLSSGTALLALVFSYISLVCVKKE